MNKQLIIKARSMFTEDLSRTDRIVVFIDSDVKQMVYDYTVGLPMNVAKYGVWQRIDDTTIYSPSKGEYYRFVNINEPYYTDGTKVMIMENGKMYSDIEYMLRG